MTKFYATAAAVGLLAIVAGTWAVTAFWQEGDEFAQCRSGSVAGGDIGGPFTLVDGTGATVTDTDVITGPSLVYFGYTFCPDVCPLDVSRNVIAVEILEEQGIMVTPVFISIDPERDTPGAVADFAANHHPRMIGLTGSPEQVREASRAYKTYYAKQDSDDEFYLVDHSTFTYLMTPEDGFLDFFKRDLSPEGMAERVACFTGS